MMMRVALVLALLATLARGGDETIVLLLDTSGSMAGQEAAMVEGTNAVLSNMAQTLDTAGWDGTFNVQLYTFSGRERRLLIEAPLKSRPSITLDHYGCGGSTPLYDVIGQTLHSMPDNSTLVIATDGEDNNSYEYGRSQVTKLLEIAQKERDIHVIYVYKGEDAFSAAHDMNIPGGVHHGTATIAIGYASLGEGMGTLGVAIGNAASAHVAFRHLVVSK